MNMINDVKMAEDSAGCVVYVYVYRDVCVCVYGKISNIR